MITKHTDEIAANKERAEKSIDAARELFRMGYYDFAASRAYYAVFYAATAALLCEELEFRKHSGVIAAVHQKFVKTGKLDVKLGKDLNWLFELRSVGDYEVTVHVPRQDAEKAIEAAEALLHAMKDIMESR